MIDVRPLTRGELDRVGAALPLSRFRDWRDDSTYLVAWDGRQPIGHVHIAWTGTELGLPELQDFFVIPERRGAGVGTLLTNAAEAVVARSGYRRCSLSVSEENAAAQRLYERLGYDRADHPPKRVHGTIKVRGGTLDVDDTLIYFTKEVDFAAARSS